MIATFIQGTRDADRRIFGSLGGMTTSRALHQALGAPITSAAGDVWHLALHDHDVATGFACSRLARTVPTVHVRYLTSLASAGEAAELLRAVLDWASDKAQEIYTFDRPEAAVWRRQGFKIGTARRGGFVRWERQLRTKNAG